MKTTERTIKAAEYLESYLNRLEKRRDKDEPLNQRAYRDAREMAAWLSVYKHGNERYKKRAAVAINSFCGCRRSKP